MPRTDDPAAKARWPGAQRGKQGTPTPAWRYTRYALHTDSIIYSARYGRTKLTTSKIIAALEVVIGTYLLYLLLNLVLYGCTYGLQGWNVSIQSSLHYASSIYNLTFLQMFFMQEARSLTLMFWKMPLTPHQLFLCADSHLYDLLGHDQLTADRDLFLFPCRMPFPYLRADPHWPLPPAAPAFPHGSAGTRYMSFSFPLGAGRIRLVAP